MEEAPHNDPKDELLELGIDAENCWGPSNPFQLRQSTPGRSFHDWYPRKQRGTPTIPRNNSDVRIRTVNERPKQALLGSFHSQNTQQIVPKLTRANSIAPFINGLETNLITVKPSQGLKSVFTRMASPSPPRQNAKLPTVGLVLLPLGSKSRGVENLEENKQAGSHRFQTVVAEPPRLRIANFNHPVDSKTNPLKVKPSGLMQPRSVLRFYAQQFRREKSSEQTSPRHPASDNQQQGTLKQDADGQRALLKILHQSQSVSSHTGGTEFSSRRDELNHIPERGNSEQPPPIFYFKMIYNKGKPSKEHDSLKAKFFGQNLVNGSRLGKHFFAQGVLKSRDQSALGTNDETKLHTMKTNDSQLKSISPGVLDSLEQSGLLQEVSQTSNPSKVYSMQTNQQAVPPPAKSLRTKMLRESERFLGVRTGTVRADKKQEADSSQSALQSFNSAASPVVGSRGQVSFLRRVNSQFCVENPQKAAKM